MSTARPCPRRRRAQRASVLLWAALALLLPNMGVATEKEAFDLVKEECLVEAAARRLQPLAEAPSSATVITGADIQRHGWTTLAEVLRNIRGFYVTYDRNYWYVGVRGFGRPADWNDRILLLIDGHVMNGNIYGDAYMGSELPIDMEAIDRIEIVRGPGSALYGSNALFAVINVVTKTPTAKRGVAVGADKASFGTSEGWFSFTGGGPADTRIAVSATGLRSAGQDLYFREYDAPDLGNGWARGADGETGRSAMFSLIRRDLSVRGFWSSRDKHVPTGAWETTFGHDGTKSTDERGYIELAYRYPGTRLGSYEVKLYHDWYRYGGIWFYEDDPPLESRDIGRSNWSGVELRDIARLGTHSILTLGATLEHDWEVHQEVWDVDPYYLYVRSRLTGLTDWSVYFQEELALVRQWRLTLGLRRDDYETFGAVNNPRVALVGPARDGTQLKLMYGRAFRPPSYYDLYYDDVDATLSNPNLLPETVDTYEAAVEQRLPLHSVAQWSVYRYMVHRLIDQVPVGESAVQSQNVGTVRTTGVEIGIETSPGGGIEASADLALQSARDDETEDRLTNAPEILAYGRFFVPVVGDRLGLSWDTRWVGARYTNSRQKTSGYAVTDIGLVGNILDGHMRLALRARNVFNAAYSHPGGNELLEDLIPQDRRAWSLEFRVGNGL
jgi:outer membrane cobalamin receptor